MVSLYIRISIDIRISGQPDIGYSRIINWDIKLDIPMDPMGSGSPDISDCQI